jgi:hypothetical protein
MDTELQEDWGGCTEQPSAEARLDRPHLLPKTDTDTGRISAAGRTRRDLSPKKADPTEGEKR